MWGYGSWLSDSTESSGPGSLSSAAVGSDGAALGAGAADGMSAPESGMSGAVLGIAGVVLAAVGALGITMAAVLGRDGGAPIANGSAAALRLRRRVGRRGLPGARLGGRRGAG